MNDAKQNARDDSRRKAQEKRKYSGNQMQGGAPADWGGVDSVALVAAIQAITRDGGAVRFGYSRDGGAYAIGIYGDGDPFTIYKSPNEDIDSVLKGLAEDYGK